MKNVNSSHLLRNEHCWNQIIADPRIAAPNVGASMARVEAGPAPEGSFHNFWKD